jgi:MoaA/NifB/PqqE/SkfB family radical SAM enzyme
MKLSGLHLLLTYQCTFECDHCFAWGSPWQSGTMTLETIREILRQARQAGTVQSIYFEGGEPFMYYATLLQGVRLAARMGFQVGIVSNAYWATSLEDAVEWLRPLARYIQNISVSSDLFHYDEKLSQQAQDAAAAAEKLGIAVGTLSIARPEEKNVTSAFGQLPEGESAVMYRGRAVEKLISLASRQPWDSFTECPHENLREPGRVHVDPFGNLHICQGIVIGNLFEEPLAEICESYDPDANPIIGPLLRSGPAELVRRYQLSHLDCYADACHLCYESRRGLRGQLPEMLKPDAMYGIYGDRQ